jgi:hypothetical protein
VKIADDEGVSPSSSVITQFPVLCFSPRVMYKILSKTAPNLRMNWSNNLSKKLRNSYNAMKRLLREINM